MKNFIQLLFLLLTALPLAAVDVSSWTEEIRISVLEDSYPEMKEVRIFGADTVKDVIGNIPGREFRPWTSQLRPSGFVETEAGLVIGINGGYPLLFKPDTGKFIQPELSIAQEYLSKSRGLTIGTIYVDSSGRAGFHLYRDRFFNPEVQISDSSENRLVVIEVYPGEKNNFSLGFPDYSFAAENPDWEPVEFIRKDDKNIIAWKYSDDKKSRFRYIIHDRNGLAVDEIDENYFRDAYDLSPVESAPFALRGFIQAVRDGTAGDDLQNAGDIFLSLPPSVNNSPRAYFSGAASVSDRLSSLPVQFKVCSDGDAWYVLNEDAVFVCSSNIIKYELPELPDDFKYTDIRVGNRLMLLSWEESRFPFVGRSGMMLIKMRDILN